MFHGIDIDADSTTDTIVGGAATGAGNRIAFAQTIYSGVRVRSNTVNNLISGNCIFSNGAAGLNLGGNIPTSIYNCESGIPAGTANAGQNFPILSNVFSGNFLQVHGTLNGKAGNTYSLEFFASPSGDASGYGEGQVFLGRTNLTLGLSSCVASFSGNLPASVPSNWLITATAALIPANNTSEFSAWTSILPVPRLQSQLSNTKNQISLSWTNDGVTFVLQQAFSLAPPITWVNVTNAPVLTNNTFIANVDPDQQRVLPAERAISLPVSYQTKYSLHSGTAAYFRSGFWPRKANDIASDTKISIMVWRLTPRFADSSASQRSTSMRNCRSPVRKSAMIFWFCFCRSLFGELRGHGAASTGKFTKVPCHFFAEFLIFLFTGTSKTVVLLIFAPVRKGKASLL